MNTYQTNQTYASPLCEVNDIQAEGILCGSPYAVIETAVEDDPINW